MYMYLWVGVQCVCGDVYMEVREQSQVLGID